MMMSYREQRVQRHVPNMEACIRMGPFVNLLGFSYHPPRTLYEYTARSSSSFDSYEMCELDRSIAVIEVVRIYDLSVQRSPVEFELTVKTRNDDEKCHREKDRWAAKRNQ